MVTASPLGAGLPERALRNGLGAAASNELRVVEVVRLIEPFVLLSDGAADCDGEGERPKLSLGPSLCLRGSTVPTLRAAIR